MEIDTLSAKRRIRAKPSNALLEHYPPLTADLSQSFWRGIQWPSPGKPMSNPLAQFEKTLLSLEKQRKSRIYAIVHTDEPHHLCTPDFWGFAAKAMLDLIEDGGQLSAQPLV